jgi:hypothetical protein
MRRLLIAASLLSTMCAHQKPPSEKDALLAYHLRLMSRHASSEEIERRRATRHEASQTSIASLRGVLPDPILRLCERLEADCGGVYGALSREGGALSVSYFADFRVYAPNDATELAREAAPWFDGGSTQLIPSGRAIETDEDWSGIRLELSVAHPEWNGRGVPWSDALELMPFIRRGVLMPEIVTLLQPREVWAAHVSGHGVGFEVFAPPALRDQIVQVAAAHYVPADNGRLVAIAGGRRCFLSTKVEATRVIIDADY